MRTSQNLQAAVVMLLAAGWLGLSATAATFTWSGLGGNSNWGTGANWVGSASPPNDGTADILITGSTGLTPNVNAPWSIKSLTMDGSSAAFVLGGSQLTIQGSGVLTTAAITCSGGNLQTVNNAVQIGGTQTWSSSGALLLNGNVTAAAASAVRISAGSYNNIRLAGNNAGFAANIELLGGDRDMVLLTPSAMIGGTIIVGGSGANSSMHISGSGSPGTYTMGVGTGAGQLQFRNVGWGGIGPADADATWDPGNGANYALTAGGLDFGAPAGGSPGLYFGNAASLLVLTGSDKGFYGKTNSGPAAAVVTVRSGLSDDGTTRNLSVVGGNMVLTKARSGGSGAGATTINNFGSLAISNLNQIFSGNLNLSTSGTLTLDGIDWATFTGTRAYGTGTNQWQLNGGGFAARGADLLINSNPTGFTWDNRNFTLGSTAYLNGALYANKAVTISVPFSLGSGTARSIQLLGKTADSLYDWSLVGPVHELSGKLGGTVTSLTLQGRGPYNQYCIGGMVRISNATNDFTGPITVTGGGAVGIFTSDGAFGNAANTVKASDNGGGGGSGMVMFEDINAGGSTTFTKALTIEATNDGSGGKAGFGSYAGDTVYTGTVTVTQTGGTWPNIPVHVQSGTMTLGATGAPATFANNRTAAAVYNKGGPGELILANANYGAGSMAGYTWVNREGTLTSTVDPSMTGSNGGLLASSYINLDNLIYTSNWATWKVTTNDQTYLTNNGYGHFGFNNLEVAAGRTLTLNMGNAILGAGDGSTVWQLNKRGAGTWIYTTTATGGTWGANGFIQVDDGTLEVRSGGSFGGGVGLRLSGGTALMSGAGNPFSRENGKPFEIDADGGKLGLATTVAADVVRWNPINAWTQGTAPVTMAARGNYNLIFGNAAFPDINAGTTLLVQRDGSGTGEVQVYDTAVTVNGTIGGSGRLQMGNTATGTLTVAGTLAPGSSPGTLTIDGNLTMGNNATYNWELGWSGAADSTTIAGTGALTLGANTVVKVIGYQWVPPSGATQYDIFTWPATSADPAVTNWILDWSQAGNLYGGSVVVDTTANRAYITGLVPEPGALLLLTAGLLGLMRRRR